MSVFGSYFFGYTSNGDFYIRCHEELAQRILKSIEPIDVWRSPMSKLYKITLSREMEMRVRLMADS